MKRSSELEQLSRTEDHLLQSFSSLNAVPPTKDWTEVRVHSSYVGTVRRAVAQLEETLRKQMKKLLEAELKIVQQYAVNVTLNPETAYPKLILSDDGKVKEKTHWTLGVARESIDRKGKIKVCPRNGYWTVWLRNGNVYHANTSPSVRLLLKSKPQKVGVFVDYEESMVCFYDVDAEDLIYSFTGCNFTVKLYPYFSPCFNDGGRNSAPLIIVPVKNTYLTNE
ncbi:pyrin-like [Siniperca chuatsi]|uniref:pyrin-like n=1 Tax=Siniperca chuatsi TaxID=119488 RepID=UPI001CE0D562|nr:pyrin-like [Siniperca chuatsi]